MTDLGALWTLGYQGIGTADDLRRLLAGTGIDIIVDVRLRPFGRSPFNGPMMSRLLVEAAGPTYRSDPRLGNVLYRTGGIQIADMAGGIEDVEADLRAGRSVALMCLCADVAECHRLTLAEEVRRRLPDVQIVHLPVRPASARLVAILPHDPTDADIEAFVRTVRDE